VWTCIVNDGNLGASGVLVAGPHSKNDQTMLYWHFSYTDFLDEIKFETGVEKLVFVASYWQVGMALGKSKEPVRLWFLKFDRLGLLTGETGSSPL
jgi:hypothetical protein